MLVKNIYISKENIDIKSDNLKKIEGIKYLKVYKNVKKNKSLFF